MQPINILPRPGYFKPKRVKQESLTSFYHWKCITWNVELSVTSSRVESCWLFLHHRVRVLFQTVSFESGCGRTQSTSRPTGNRKSWLGGWRFVFWPWKKQLDLKKYLSRWLSTHKSMFTWPPVISLGPGHRFWREMLLLKDHFSLLWASQMKVHIEAEAKAAKVCV